MKIVLHIERLILEGVRLDPGGRQRLQAAAESELARLLARGGVSPALRAGGAVAQLQGGSIQLRGGVDSSQLGTQLAQAVYGGLSQSGRR